MKFVPPVTAREDNSISRLDKNLMNASHVLVRNEVKKGLMPNYKGPYEVLERHEKFFKLRLPHGDNYVTVDRMKVAYSTDDYLPVIPRRFIQNEQKDQGVTISVNVKPETIQNKDIRQNRRHTMDPKTNAPNSNIRNNVNNSKAGESSNSDNNVNDNTKRTRSGRQVNMPSKFGDFILNKKPNKKK